MRDAAPTWKLCNISTLSMSNPLFCLEKYMNTYVCFSRRKHHLEESVQTIETLNVRPSVTLNSAFAFASYHSKGCCERKS